MLTVTIPDRLTNKVREFAGLFCQTPEEYLIEIIEERIEHESAYNETGYLAKSEKNRKRLANAVREIREGKYEIVYGIRNLNVIERLNIITDIWDEIKESQELEAVSEDDRKLLLNRLANYRANPDSATDWEKLRQEIHKRYAEKS